MLRLQHQAAERLRQLEQEKEQEAFIAKQEAAERDRQRREL
jgi:hypothetical protein